MPNIKYVCYGDHQWVKCDSQKVDGDTQPLNLESGLKTVSDDDPKFSGNFSDKLLYIYTSGTTGLPKAAIIRQSRYIMLSSSNDVPALRGQDQVIYCPMPLYHSLGGGLAVSLSLIHGHSLAIRRKFSPSAFWQDCIFYKCTVSKTCIELIISNFLKQFICYIFQFYQTHYQVYFLVFLDCLPLISNTYVRLGSCR